MILSVARFRAQSCCAPVQHAGLTLASQRTIALAKNMAGSAESKLYDGAD
ncbi:hypothetical protein OLX23_03655 [Novosphingobium sp. JCM 18896]|nr:hypothetical protein [Novosphingobium sp. JCM 18896]